MLFSENLYRLRVALGLSQAQLSEATGGSVSSAWVAKAERGKVVSPRFETLRIVATALGVTVEELVGVGVIENNELRYSLPPGTTLPAWKRELLDDMIRSMIKQIVEFPNANEKPD